MNELKRLGWIGVDLDGTLAEYHGWVTADTIGAPIAPMVARVKAWLAEDKDVRIFTARGSRDAADRDLAYPAIRKWCVEHLGQELVITNVKDLHMIALWDDRAVQVRKNTGIPVLTLADQAKEILAINTANGWSCITPEGWSSSPYHVPALLALVASEVSEALEDFRKDNREHFAEELVDVIIRILDLGGGLEMDLDTALAAKLEKNRQRGYRHGNKRV